MEPPSNFRILGLGEVLWDLLPNGRQLGGAPSNFAYHARALGADASIISRVGEDDLGREALQRLRQLGLPTDLVQTDPAHPTGAASVEVDAAGQPRFVIHENTAWDWLEETAAAQRAVSAADALCFGTLAQRNRSTRNTLRALIAVAPPTALRIFDVNLRGDYFCTALIRESLALANALKLSDAELPQIASMLGLSGNTRDVIARLAADFRLRVVACTRGDHGSLLWHDGEWSEHPGIPAQVQDTVGAGDSFTAAMTLGLLLGWELDRVNQGANEVASFVASSAGATPRIPERLAGLFLAS
jgi:fructokinase